MHYSDIQFVSYVTNTVRSDPGEDDFQNIALDGTSLDVEARCALMARAMETAREALAATSSTCAGPVLKVFMAPECFFYSPRQAYRTDDVQRTIARLQAIAAGGEWSDWIFSFGTIVGTSAPTVNGAPGAFYNFALIQEGGGAGAGPAGARILAKPLIRRTEADVGDHHAGGEATKGLPKGPREQQLSVYDGAGIFTMRGLTWAADVCQDASRGLVVRAPQLPGEPQVQIQLHPSAGSRVSPDGIVAVPGGFVFNVDGAGQDTVLRQVGTPDPIAPCVRVGVSDDVLALSAETIAVDRLYPQGPGEIVIFDPQPLPPATDVQGMRQSLLWRASDSYQFVFDLIYDEYGRFSTILVAPRRLPIDMFHGNSYFLPLDIVTCDPLDQQVEITMYLGGGRDGYDFALWCKIAVPGFVFEGVAFQFGLDWAGPAPQTIW
ncbi:hypothetical protein [Sphingomonas sp. DC1600-2]|jgi:hypothetical protein|uniref:hypothetical protein n=1 Tax=unclassified Sphingomonas TaxID=196159 RepID=UPI003CE8B25B